MSDEMPMNDPDYASGIAAFEEKNFNAAMRFLLKYANEGDAEAQHKVVIMYQNGLGVVANDDNAFRWMKAAADQGHAIAQHGLGFMYLEGECVDQDLPFEKAADQGLIGSMTTIAMMYEEGRGVDADQEKAQEWYKKAGF